MLPNLLVTARTAGTLGVPALGALQRFSVGTSSYVFATHLVRATWCVRDV